MEPTRFTRSSGSKSRMHSTIEGCIRQSQQNPLTAYPLTLLIDQIPVTAYSVVKRGSSIKVDTDRGEMPIYAFQMNRELMHLLKNQMEVWYE